MANSDSELKGEVRELTDYTSTSVLSADALTEVFNIAKRDIQGEANTTISDWYADLDSENALFWTACLFTKIKAGEIDGVPMSLGDIDYDTLRAAGQTGGDKPLIWYQKAQQYSARLTDSGGRFGQARISRGQSRAYGSESDTSDPVDYGGGQQ